MKIATWNVNSIKARLEPALAWLKEARPDVVCLQEIKTVDENFDGPNAQRAKDTASSIAHTFAMRLGAIDPMAGRML